MFGFIEYLPTFVSQGLVNPVIREKEWLPFRYIRIWLKDLGTLRGTPCSPSQVFFFSSLLHHLTFF